MFQLRRVMTAAIIIAGNTPTICGLDAHRHQFEPRFVNHIPEARRCPWTFASGDGYGCPAANLVAGSRKFGTSFIAADLSCPVHPGQWASSFVVFNCAPVPTTPGRGFRAGARSHPARSTGLSVFRLFRLGGMRPTDGG